VKKIFFILISLFLVNVVSAQNLVINEFLASNDSSAADEYSEYDDFIEIYNTDTVAIDIGGMYITDDLTNPTQWQIPSDSIEITTIPAGGFLVLWADKQTDQGPLHVNVKLGSGGEQIGLYNSDGITAIDTLTFGAQETDVSFGQMPDGSDDWQTFVEHTDVGYTTSPGRSNVTLKINEFLAKNDNVNQDEFGNYGDWIELFNYGVNDVDVTGMLMTDDLETPNMYAFNPAFVPANGYLLIWADGTSEDVITDPDFLHANFKLGAGGEAVGLFLNEYTVIDSFSFGAQTADISTGRYPDGTDNWLTFSVPSPNESNLLAEGSIISDIQRTPQFPEFTDDITITANVTTNALGLNVILKYNIGAGYVDVTMVDNGNDIFSGVIPAQPKGIQVKWYIEASDDAPSVVTFPTDAPTEILTYRVTDWTPTAVIDLTIDEPSGLAFNANTGTLFTHNDGTISDIYEISTSGELLNTLDVDGVDFEGVAFNANYDTIFVVEEAGWKVVKYSLDGTKHGEFEVTHDPGQVDGLEGIAVDHTNGNIFVLHEKNNPELIELTMDGTEINRTTLNFSSDISGITIHPTWGTLFIISDEGLSLNEVTKEGVFLRSWYIPLDQAEGVTFGATTDVMYMVADRGNKLYEFPFNFDPYSPLPSVYINEFMASNDAAYADENGEFDDWIELYNPGDDPVDIGGMYITDALTDPTLWKIPDTNSVMTTIPAKGYLVLWADKQPAQGVLHLNLKLSAGGEDIGLYGSDGISEINALTFNSQETNVSYGRFPDGGDYWAFFLESTPGATNDNAVSVNDNNEDLVITEYKLSQNYPNPFNPSTVIKFSIPESDFVTLKVFSVLGQDVAELVNEVKAAGNYKVIFDASQLTTGIYFYTVQAGKFSLTKKMLLLK